MSDRSLIKHTHKGVVGRMFYVWSNWSHFCSKLKSVDFVFTAQLPHCNHEAQSRCLFSSRVKVDSFFRVNPVHFTSSFQNDRWDFSWYWKTASDTLYPLVYIYCQTANLLLTFLCSVCTDCHFSWCSLSLTRRTTHTHTHIRHIPVQELYIAFNKR